MINSGEMFRWFQWYPLRLLCNHLSRHKVTRLGYLMGALQFHLRKQKQRIAKDELLKILPDNPGEKELKILIKNSFKESGSVFLETFCFPRINSNNIDQWMRIRGENHLHQALAKGQGAMLVLVHYGANQMIMAALGHRNYKINQIGSRPDDWHRLSGTTPTALEKKTFNIRLKLEKALPANFIYIDKSMRPVYDCLKNNGIMLLACDGRAGKRFLQTRMCGRTMNLSAGPFRIAAATGAALIPVFPVRSEDGTHELHIEAPVYPETQNSTLSWAEKAAIVYGKRLSEWVRYRPDHYTMLMTEAAIRSNIDPVPLFEDFRNGSQ